MMRANGELAPCTRHQEEIAPFHWHVWYDYIWRGGKVAVLSNMEHRRWIPQDCRVGMRLRADKYAVRVVRRQPYEDGWLVVRDTGPYSWLCVVVAAIDNALWPVRRLAKRTGWAWGLVEEDEWFIGRWKWPWQKVKRHA